MSVLLLFKINKNAIKFNKIKQDFLYIYIYINPHIFCLAMAKSFSAIQATNRIHPSSHVCEVSFPCALYTVNRLKWRKENDWLCNTNTRPEGIQVHCTVQASRWSVRLWCLVPINLVGTDWPLSLYMQCVWPSQCLQKERKKCVWVQCGSDNTQSFMLS